MRRVYADRLATRAISACVSLGSIGVVLAACDAEHRDYGSAVERARAAAGSGGETMTASSEPGEARTAQGSDPTAVESESGAPPFQPASEAGGLQPAAEPSSARCAEGATESCGPASEEGVCRFGTRTCAEGLWGECVGAVLPSARNCASAEDNDCDGQADNMVDDTCRCPAQGTQACDPHPGLDGKGQCQPGQQECILAADGLSSDWGPCSGSIGPSDADSCSVMGNDADCDGVPNGGCDCIEGTTVPCGPSTDLGICQRGTSTCVNGAFGACEGAVFSSARDCSSTLDNDCNGLPDNTIDATCACAIGSNQACGAHPGRDGNGACRAGTQQCQAAAGNASSRFGVCTDSVGPAQRDSCAELGDDADCDGVRNGGCQCIAGGGNAPCAADPNNSRCSPQGTCVPCQGDGDCSLVSGGRAQCVAGQCVAARCGDGILATGEACDDGNTNDSDACSNACQVRALVTVSRFSWNSRQPAVAMGTTQNRVCFLTGVGGAFNSADDSVAIVSQGGQWVLSGSTGVGGFAEARAACTTGQASEQSTWRSGEATVQLGNDDQVACFLTAVAGAFQGGGESAGLRRVSGIWQLNGDVLQDDIRVSARCMPVQEVSDGFVMGLGTASPFEIDTVQDGACYLTFIGGDFGAEGDLVETDWNGVGWQIERRVGGTRQLRATAACFGRNGGVGVPPL